MTSQLNYRATGNTHSQLYDLSASNNRQTTERETGIKHVFNRLYLHTHSQCLFFWWLPRSHYRMTLAATAEKVAQRWAIVSFFSSNPDLSTVRSFVRWNAIRMRKHWNKRISQVKSSHFLVIKPFHQEHFFFFYYAMCDQMKLKTKQMKEILPKKKISLSKIN